MMRRPGITSAVLAVALVTVISMPARGQCPFESKLTTTDATPDDWFGHSLAVSGDTAIVGAPYAENVDGGCNCCSGGDGLGCNDVTCESAVCAVEPVCCFGVWATRCDDLAANQCSCCPDDSGAAYILQKTGDEWQEFARLQADDVTSFDSFGWSVAIDGDTAIVGAPYDNAAGSESGSAYVFRNVADEWLQIAKLIGDDSAAGDQFGYSVAIDGDTIVVGASLDGDLGTYSGSAYVFREIGGTWQQLTKLHASDGAAGDIFGNSVAIGGDTAIIGAPSDDDAGSASGSAYVFRETGGGWQEIAKLTATDAAEGDRFGHGIAIDGNTALIGAYMVDDVVEDRGAAYLFRESAGTWQQIAKLRAHKPDDQWILFGAGWFGASVALNGEIAVVGAIFDNDQYQNSGSAYIFREIAGDWQLIDILRATDEKEFGAFGASVAVGGHTAFVGATHPAAPTPTDSGALYYFDIDLAGIDCNVNGVPDPCELAGGTVSDCNTNGIPDECDVLPTKLAKLHASDPAEFDSFGYSVAISGDLAIVGARGDDHTGFDSGSAYTFRNMSGVWAQTAELTGLDTSAQDQFGGSVALSGNTAIVGAIGDVVAGSGSGSAYVLRDVGGIWQQVAKLAPTDIAIERRFGIGVAISGSTAIIGANLDNHACPQDPNCSAGAAYVFREMNGEWQQIAKLTAADAAKGDQFGFRVAISGNTALIGAWQADNAGGVNAGSAYIFREVAGSWIEVAKLVAADGGTGQFFGFSVALDENTAVVGAYRDNDAGTESGSAYVFKDIAGVWQQTAKLTALDAATSDRFGLGVAVSGSTIAITAVGDNPGGSAYIFRNIASSWTQVWKLKAPDVASGGTLSSSIAIDGSIALVASTGDDDYGSGSGAVYVIDLVPVSTDCNVDSLPDECGLLGDLNDNGIVDLFDHTTFTACHTGSNVLLDPACCLCDQDHDGDADLADFAILQRLLPNPP